MILKKHKTPLQMANLRLALSKLSNLGNILQDSGEPMLASRLSALEGDVEQALFNSEEEQN